MNKLYSLFTVLKSIYDKDTNYQLFPLSEKSTQTAQKATHFPIVAASIPFSHTKMKLRHATIKVRMEESYK